MAGDAELGVRGGDGGGGAAAAAVHSSAEIPATGGGGRGGLALRAGLEEKSDGRKCSTCDVCGNVLLGVLCLDQDIHLILSCLYIFIQMLIMNVKMCYVKKSNINIKRV